MVRRLGQRRENCRSLPAGHVGEYSRVSRTTDTLAVQARSAAVAEHGTGAIVKQRERRKRFRTV